MKPLFLATLATIGLTSCATHPKPTPVTSGLTAQAGHLAEIETGTSAVQTHIDAARKALQP